jgi:hypothetical protein
MEIFSEKFVEAVRNEINNQLNAGKTVTRKTVMSSLGYEKEGVELIISQMFTIGILSEFKILKRAGIVPVEKESNFTKKKKEKKELAEEEEYKDELSKALDKDVGDFWKDLCDLAEEFNIKRLNYENDYDFSKRVIEETNSVVHKMSDKTWCIMDKGDV